MYADGCTQATECTVALGQYLELDHESFRPYRCFCPKNTVLDVSHTSTRDPLAPDTWGQMWGVVSSSRAAGDKIQQEVSCFALTEAPGLLHHTSQ